MKYYLKDVEAVLKETASKREGLKAEEAQRRLDLNGKNKLAEGKKKSMFKRFIEQLEDPMIIILIVAAAISAVVSSVQHESFADVFIILFVVVLNAILGVVQESKAEKAIEALKEMTASTTKVFRDGKQVVIKSEDLVKGDIISLEAGDAVPADCRIMESFALKSEEAALTGESVPVEKSPEALKGDEIALGDRVNMVYMGSVITYGRAKAIVCDTGMQTEMGKIADALTQAQEEKTPLQQKLGQLSNILTYLVLGICVVIFAINLITAGNLSFESTILPSFMVAVSLAVAAIPEGLVAVVTIVLSIGVTKMSKANAVIRRLTAVETLGCTQIICSDKTGTLTQNKMTVVQTRAQDEKALASSLALCSDAELDENNVAQGDPTQNAVVNFAYKIGLSKNDLKKSYPRVGEIPFDSMRKLMTTVHSTESCKYIQHTTGAPDVVISRCTKVLLDDQIVPMTQTLKDYWYSQNKELASQALRVLAAATKTLDNMPDSADYQNAEAMENDLVFLGLVGMIDPVRPEVPEAINKCKKAGIRPIMITGDHKDTATAIAMQLGIISSADEALSGAQLDAMSDAEFATSVTKYSVYARVKPENKVRIVKAWKALGYITAMTGDGVNDAPSIKSADIGIGMGITGTDVTKNVADMVLADDNFATIVKAVEEGRKVYSNIRKAIQFLLSSNMSEVLTIFTATLLGFTILEAPHLLWINLITDCFPALALGMEAGEANIMDQKPRNSKDGIFAGGVGFDVAYQGLLVTVLTLIAYYLGKGPLFDPACGTAAAQGTTMAFLTLSMAEIFHSYNMRSLKGSIFKLKTHNIYLFGAMIVSLLLTFVVIEVPAIATLFDFATIDIVEYLTAMGLAVAVIPVVEIVKAINRFRASRRLKGNGYC